MLLYVLEQPDHAIGRLVFVYRKCVAPQLDKKPDDATLVVSRVASQSLLVTSYTPYPSSPSSYTAHSATRVAPADLHVEVVEPAALPHSTAGSSSDETDSWSVMSSTSVKPYDVENRVAPAVPSRPAVSVLGGMSANAHTGGGMFCGGNQVPMVAAMP